MKFLAILWVHIFHKSLCVKYEVSFWILATKVLNAKVFSWPVLFWQHKCHGQLLERKVSIRINEAQHNKMKEFDTFQILNLIDPWYGFVEKFMFSRFWQPLPFPNCRWFLRTNKAESTHFNYVNFMYCNKIVERIFLLSLSSMQKNWWRWWSCNLFVC